MIGNNTDNRILFLLFLFLFFVFPFRVQAAGTLKIGQECTSDDQCITEECEESDVEKTDESNQKKRYCVCDEKDHCAAQYGGNPDDWSCSNGASATFDLNYCIREKNQSTNQADNIKAPIGFTSASALDALLDPGAAVAATVNEIKQITLAPQVKINIPGLSFTDPSTIKPVEENGNDVLYIPFFGQYIAAVYRYAVVAAGVIAIIIIIIAGVRWTLSAGSSDAIASAKKYIVGGVTGLVIAVGSYTLLYTINPNLVEFKSLRIPFISGELAGDGHEEDENKLGNPDTFSIPKKCSPSDNGIVSFPKGGDASNLNTIFVKGGVNCSQFGQCSAGVSACWRACLAQRPPEKRTTPIPGYNHAYLGLMDCNTSGTKRPRGNITTIVLHEGFGSGALTHWWFTRVKKGTPVSSQYMVGRDGQIYQIMDEQFIASHTATGGYNRKSIGIDFLPRCLSSNQASAAGVSVSQSCYYTSSQYNAIAKLISDIRGRGTPISTVIGHCEVQGNRSDPRNFDWTKIGSSISAHADGCRTFNPNAEAIYNLNAYVCCVGADGSKKTVSLKKNETVGDVVNICEKNDAILGVPGRC